MFRNVLLTAMLLGAVSPLALADDPAPGKQVARSFALGKREDSPRLGYWLYLPKDYRAEGEKKFPLVLFLHGSGERGSDLDKVLIHGPPKLIAGGKEFPFIVVSPQCPENQFWNIDILSRLLDDLEKDHAVDKQRIYVTGLSMGGFATWSLAASTPFRFAAAAPICGGGRPEWSYQLKNLPISVYHGEKDEGVKLERSQEMVDAIKAAGGDVQLTVYPGVGHDSWTETYDDSGFYEWLLSKVLPAKR